MALQFSTSYVRSLEKELECSICLSIYTNPKILPCHHTFCCHCLDELAEKSLKNRQPIACPDCRTGIDLPRGTSSFNEFPSACYLNRLKDIVRVQRRENQDDLKYVEEAAAAAKSRLKETEAQLQERAEILRNQENKDNDTRRKIRQQIKKTREAIQQNCQRLMGVLRWHEQELLTEVDAFEEDAEQMFKDQKEYSELYREQLKSSAEYLRSVRQQESGNEVLKAESSAMSRAQEVLDAMANYHPLKTVYVEHKSDEDVSRRFEHSPLGRIYTGLADPQKTQTQGLKTKNVYKNFRAKFIVVTKDTEDNICYSASEHVSVQILSPAGDEVETEIEDRKDGIYTVCFTPNTEGVHLVTVRVRGQSPANSHVNVNVTNRPSSYKGVAAFGSRGSGKGQFQWPCGVAVNRAGEVAVSDRVMHRVQIFNADGQYLREFGTKGTGDGQFSCPGGLAYNKAGDIVVSDVDNSRIQVFSSTGRWVGKFGQDVLKEPFGVSVTSEDNIVVCDYKEKTVNVFSPEGVLFFHFSPGITPLSAIFCDAEYVVSLDSHVIKVFDSRGSHLHDIGQQGDEAGQFCFPWGLAVNTDDLLFVCDSINHRVQVFLLDGQFVTSFGSRGSELGQLSNPSYIAVSPDDGRVFITDYINHRVQVFQAQYQVYTL